MNIQDCRFTYTSSVSGMVSLPSIVLPQGVILSALMHLSASVELQRILSTLMDAQPSITLWPLDMQMLLLCCWIWMLTPIGRIGRDEPQLIVAVPRVNSRRWRCWGLGMPISGCAMPVEIFLFTKLLSQDVANWSTGCWSSSQSISTRPATTEGHFSTLQPVMTPRITAKWAITNFYTIYSPQQNLLSQNHPKAFRKNISFSRIARFHRGL